MFETETKDQHRVWFLGIACVVLALVAVTEGGYIALARHRNAPNRFKRVSGWGEWNSDLAFDTATGRLCKTIPVGWIPYQAASKAPETPAQDSQTSKSGDPVLDAIVGRHIDTKAAEKAAAEAAREKAEDTEFFRSLPACVDIR